MMKYPGKPVNEGIAFGKIKLLLKQTHLFSMGNDCDPELELYRYETAKLKARLQLSELYQRALETVGADNAAIFEMHKVMLEDLDYTDFVSHKIRSEKVSADFAVSAAGAHFSSVFSALEDEYIQARAADIGDITERLLDCLCLGEKQDMELEEPCIIVAEDLSPSETIRLDRGKVLGFVTRQGSVNSHTAILARMLDIPAMVNTDILLTDDLDQQEAVLDGCKGELIVAPDETILEEMKRVKQGEAQKRNDLRSYIGKESVTKGGKRIQIYANIGNVADLPAAVENGADGIGLFRSEFLFLGRDAAPAEEEQFQAYRQAAETMKGNKVIIRTLDIGADKNVPYFHLDKEENPAMGFRAIRICLARRELFQTQLRAIYRASAFGDLSVMYPMIISLQEIKAIKEINEYVKAGLREEGIPFKEIEQGIMVETPAAVMISDDLAKEVDFFSIGTNDLTQYTLALDRQNAKLDDFFEPHHPAVLKMIRIVIENGHKEGCWVGICGELGADTALTQHFVEMGIDELSVSPTFILPIRKLIRDLT